MTIKQQGGIFGRNPTFNDVETNDLEVTGSVSVPNDSISGDAINGGTATPTTLLVNTTTNPNSRNARFFGITEFDSSGATLVTFLTSNGATSLGAIGQGNYVVSGAPSNSFGIRSDVNLPIAAGGTTKVADFTVNGLAFVNGKGIDFSATSGTGTSELFDDYEEGTWTPVVNYNSSATGVSYSEQNGRYTKVGRLVTLEAEIALSNKGSGGSGRVQITGMPFSSVTNQHVGSLEVRNTTLATTGVFAELGRAGATTLRIMRNVSGSSAANIEFADMTNTSAFLLTITYETS